MKMLIVKKSTFLTNKTEDFEDVDKRYRKYGKLFPPRSDVLSQVQTIMVDQIY